MPVTRPATESLAAHLAAQPTLPGPRVLDIVGQVGFALQRLHEQGRAHGGVDADAIALHDDGAVTLQSATPAGIATPAAMAADLAALARVARAALDPAADPNTRGFLDRVAEPVRGTTPEAGDVARTALAMATGSLSPAARTNITQAEPPTDTAVAWPDEAVPDPEQRRVRNRLIAVGAAVVLVGLVLLKACGGGGQAVPEVTGDTYSTAVTSLHAHGFVARERLVAAAGGHRVGTVVAQFPAAGARPRAGTTVTLTVTR
jgi:hypothetical protein